MIIVQMMMGSNMIFLTVDPSLPAWVWFKFNKKSLLLGSHKTTAEILSSKQIIGSCHVTTCLTLITRTRAGHVGRGNREQLWLMSMLVSWILCKWISLKTHHCGPEFRLGCIYLFTLLLYLITQGQQLYHEYPATEHLMPWYNIIISTRLTSNNVSISSLLLQFSELLYSYRDSRFPPRNKLLIVSWKQNITARDQEMNVEDSCIGSWLE